MIRKRWRLRNGKINGAAVREAAKTTGVPPFIANVLLCRGIEAKDFRSFLAKSKRSIKDPMDMLDMDKAAERIKRALENKDNIVIYGDYDVDGITSTALLYDFLSSLGARVSYYIPDRKDEGYGINIIAVNKLIKAGMQLLITVDCGITAVGEVEFAKLQKTDVIITDHHTCKERIPDAADAVVNPKRKDDEYGFDGLAGVGVAFKLVLAVAKLAGLDTGMYFDRYCDLAAIGTIADVVPLTDENRVIVAKGLEKLSETDRPGLAALFEIAGISGKKITASSVAFAVAPRVNAAGRLGTARTAVELFLAKDGKRAGEIAAELDNENKERRATEQQIFSDALEMIAADANFSKKKVIVLAKEGWHNGVIGIVASRIVERFYRPCILISLDNGAGKGSGRSIEGFNLFDALSACDDLLTDFGGHAVAAGLGINESDIDEFSKKINGYAENVLREEEMMPTVKIDCMVHASNLTLGTAKAIAMLEPYGMGNEQPVFALKDAEVRYLSTVGADGKHLRLVICRDGAEFSCIGFGMGEAAEEIAPGDTVHVAFRLDINNYRDVESVQLRLADIKKA